MSELQLHDSIDRARARFRVDRRPRRADHGKSRLPPRVEAKLQELLAQRERPSGGPIPGQQVVFAAFNYGDTRAMSFAAGLPWSCLLRASQMRGFRPKSLALLRAVLAHRGI